MLLTANADVSDIVHSTDPYLEAARAMNMES